LVLGRLPPLETSNSFPPACTLPENQADPYFAAEQDWPRCEYREEARRRASVSGVGEGVIAGQLQSPGQRVGPVWPGVERNTAVSRVCHLVRPSAQWGLPRLRMICSIGCVSTDAVCGSESYAAQSPASVLSIDCEGKSTGLSRALSSASGGKSALVRMQVPRTPYRC
jgi:hypothetical protein